jgi:hypothetical protein
MSIDVPLPRTAERQPAAFSGWCARANLGTNRNDWRAPMKRRIALMLTVIGVAAAVVPVADAKLSGLAVRLLS